MVGGWRQRERIPRRHACGDSFRIGSMSKTLVAVVALLLVENGVIALDDRAADYLPAEVVARVANADRVTLRQLLAMRSGISDYLERDRFWVVVETEPDQPVDSRRSHHLRLRSAGHVCARHRLLFTRTRITS